MSHCVNFFFKNVIASEAKPAAAGFVVPPGLLEMTCLKTNY